jgi:hypothetical protein
MNEVGRSLCSWVTSVSHLASALPFAFVLTYAQIRRFIYHVVEEIRGGSRLSLRAPVTCSPCQAVQHSLEVCLPLHVKLTELELVYPIRQRKAINVDIVLP